MIIPENKIEIRKRGLGRGREGRCCGYGWHFGKHTKPKHFLMIGCVIDVRCHFKQYC
jgi:hypothetical protein